MNDQLTVNQLAKLAGVSVRTLHVYDKKGLLKPLKRNYSKYRYYGEKELLRLQQILSYKQIGLSLKEIQTILDNPDFDQIKALEGHKQALIQQKQQLDIQLNTIVNTLSNLKNNTTMYHYEELFKGMSKEKAKAIHDRAIINWGEDAVIRSEKALLKLGEEQGMQLKAEQQKIFTDLILRSVELPESDNVQHIIARHYLNTCAFWGFSIDDKMSAVRYKAIADLYVSSENYLTNLGMPYKSLDKFINKAMYHFADQHLS